MKPFVWKVRVYWEDTDAGGVVYHSRYLNFFSQAMTRGPDRQPVVTARLTAVCLQADNFKPTRMPRWIRAEIDNAN